MTESSATVPQATYNAEHFAPLFAAEPRHFWFRSRNRCIAAATRLIPNPESIRDIIEHGCGTGFVLCELRRLFPKARVVGADLFAEGLAFARRRFDGELIQTDVLKSGFREAFDLAGLFDVLEHMDDDLEVLNAIRSQLRPGGRLLLTVPAHGNLWSEFDTASGHRRRYSRRQLELRLLEAGFQVEYCTEFMLVLAPLMWIHRRLFWARARSGQAGDPAARMGDELRVHPLLNRVLELVLRPEPWWIGHRRRLPVGTSVLALATKR